DLDEHVAQDVVRLLRPRRPKVRANVRGDVTVERAPGPLGPDSGRAEDRIEILAEGHGWFPVGTGSRIASAPTPQRLDAVRTCYDEDRVSPPGAPGGCLRTGRAPGSSPPAQLETPVPAAPNASMRQRTPSRRT